MSSTPKLVPEGVCRARSVSATTISSAAMVIHGEIVPRHPARIASRPNGPQAAA